MSCVDCDFFQPNYKGSDYGQCRFNPPIMLDNGDCFFPIVACDSWCGKWKVKE